MTRERAETVPCPLRAAAEAVPRSPALVDRDETLSYAGLDHRVSVAASRLLDLGCRPGDRVALYLPRDAREVVLLLALIRAGCVACPLSTRLPPRGVLRLLRRSGCSTMISDDPEVSNAAGSAVRNLDPEGLFKDTTTNFRSSDTPQLRLNRPATVIFTSGSSGVPKAVLHTFGNHYYSALGSNANIGLSPGDRWLLSLPLYHVAGLSILFRCLLAGAAAALPEPEGNLANSIADLKATHVSLVATQLRRLLRVGVEAKGLKAVLLGGGPAPGSLVGEASSRGLPVYTSYGLAEMASQVTTTPPDASGRELRTAGRVLPYREVSISGTGEILVRGETLFAGYVEGEEVDLPLDADGWFHTKDLGELDVEGRLIVRGREDNLFISGGENVQPEEIEAALERLKGVERAVVVPVPDEEFGERPAAFVQVADKDPRVDRLSGALEEELPRYKIPVAFYRWPEEADDGGMKVDRVFFKDLALRFYSDPQD
ncbi:MAG: o-succinylbenzoate--CoA ligase [Rubrobacteraceae bacterium]